MVRIVPSILAADLGRLEWELGRVSAADWLHVDVMDGHFVPDISFGYPVMHALRRYTRQFLDVHLMVTNPLDLIPSYVSAGAGMITFHQEAGTHVDVTACLDLLDRCGGVKKGLALRPATKPEAILPYLERLDMVLVMTVEPGFGGQKFMESQLATIAQVRGYIRQLNPSCLLEIDGGVNPDTARRAVDAGADVLVAGSAVFGSADPAAAIAALRG